MRIQDIADYLHLNSHYVTAIFKQKYNKTPKHYLTEIRIEKAKTYLIDTDYSLQIIANAVGLENPFSFSRLFKSMTGFSPSKYKKVTGLSKIFSTILRVPHNTWPHKTILPAGPTVPLLLCFQSCAEIGHRLGDLDLLWADRFTTSASDACCRTFLLRKIQIS